MNTTPIPSRWSVTVARDGSIVTTHQVRAPNREDAIARACAAHPGSTVVRAERAGSGRDGPDEAAGDHSQPLSGKFRGGRTSGLEGRSTARKARDH